MAKPCWKPRVNNGGNGDGLIWHMDLGVHNNGEFSMAVIQANNKMEDRSQVESGPLSITDHTLQGTFVGLYDGHGGPQASHFICNNLFPKLKKFAWEHQGISETVIKKAFAETERDFLTLVKKQWLDNPHMASVGSCCLVGVICKGLLYIANVGDSQAVMGRAARGGRNATAIQLSVEHNANIESARHELRKMHPDDPNIVVMKHRAWRVKGLIQVTKSIGDAYLKRVEFNKEPLLPKFRLSEPFTKPILSPEPSITKHYLNPDDRFLIFASDGLWEHLSNQKAVDIVHNSPRHGIAKKLVKAALKEAAKKREIRYTDLKQIKAGVRRHFHDDITVVVVYLEPHLDRTDPVCTSYLSIRAGI